MCKIRHVAQDAALVSRMREAALLSFSLSDLSNLLPSGTHVDCILNLFLISNCILIVESMITDTNHTDGHTSPSSSKQLSTVGQYGEDDAKELAECSSDGNGGGQGCMFIELGAGKGLLGQAISCVQPQAQIVFVERAGVVKYPYSSELEIFLLTIYPRVSSVTGFPFIQDKKSRPRLKNNGPRCGEATNGYPSLV